MQVSFLSHFSRDYKIYFRKGCPLDMLTRPFDTVTPPLSKQLRNGAPHTTAADALECCDVGVDEVTLVLEKCLALGLREPVVGLGRHDEDGVPLYVFQLEHVATKLVDLLARDVDDLVPRALERLPQARTFRRIGHTLEAHDRDRCAHGHHHVGVVDRAVLGVAGRERDERVVQGGGPLGGLVRIGPLRQRHVRDPVDAIEHDRASALQELAGLLVLGQIEHRAVPLQPVLVVLN